MKTTQQEIIAGLDLGTTQFRVAIGKCYEEGIEIIGVGQSPSQGMRKGEVVNLDSTATAIRKAVNEAELMAGCKVRNVVVGIAGMSIRSQISHAEVQVNQGTVSEQDILGVVESARTIQLPPDHEILHIIPCEFIIDKQTRTSQPLGMTGSTLEVTAHIVTVESASIKNVANACKLAGLKDMNIVLQSLATAETVLLPEEREQGVALIGLGAGPATIAVFSKGALTHYGHSVSVGSQQTTDLAVGLRISMVQAEQLKRLNGCCLESMMNSDDMVEIVPLKDDGRKMIPRQYIVDILGARMEEVLTLIAKQLRLSDHKGELPVGAVLTGGSSLLPGMEELAKQVIKMPVRIGAPVTFKGVADKVSLPQYSTAVGLVLLGARADGVLQG